MLRYAFFPDFKWGSNLLFWGSGNDIRLLAETLTALQSTPSEIALSEVPGLMAVGGISVVLRRTLHSSGMQRRDERTFNWDMTAEQADEFARLLAPLVGDGEPGHHYLECNSPNEITVVVSRDEYRADLRPPHVH